MRIAYPVRRFESHRGQAYFSSLPGVDIYTQSNITQASYPDLLYDDALEISNLQYLSTRKDISCKKFDESLRRDVSPYNPLTKIMEIRPGVKTHDYDLRNDRTVEQF